MNTYRRPPRGSAHMRGARDPAGGLERLRRVRRRSRVGDCVCRATVPSPRFRMRRAAGRPRRVVAPAPAIRWRMRLIRRQRRKRLRSGRADAATGSRPRRPRAANRAAGGSPAANRRGSGSSARRAETTGRSASAAPSSACRHRQHVADRLCRGLARRPCAGARAPADRRGAHRTDRRWPAGGARATGSTRRPRTPERCSCGSSAELPRHGVEKRARLRFGGAVVDVFLGEQRGVRPDRLAVGAPERIERPARQLLARIPLALAVMQQARAARSAPCSRASSSAAMPRLGRAHRLGVPFGAVAIVHRDEGRLAALRQPDVVRREIGVDAPAERFDRRPLLLGVGLGHARRFPHALDLHVVLEARLRTRRPRR